MCRVKHCTTLLRKYFALPAFKAFFGLEYLKAVASLKQATLMGTTDTLFNWFLK